MNWSVVSSSLPPMLVRLADRRDCRAGRGAAADWSLATEKMSPGLSGPMPRQRSISSIVGERGNAEAAAAFGELRGNFPPRTGEVESRTACSLVLVTCCKGTLLTAPEMRLSVDDGETSCWPVDNAGELFAV